MARTILFLHCVILVPILTLLNASIWNDLWVCLSYFLSETDCIMCGWVFFEVFGKIQIHLQSYLGLMMCFMDRYSIFNLNYLMIIDTFIFYFSYILFGYFKTRVILFLERKFIKTSSARWEDWRHIYLHVTNMSWMRTSAKIENANRPVSKGGFTCGQVHRARYVADFLSLTRYL